MIAFASLFLGLCLGVHDVELVTADTVVSVQVLLDGRPVCTLEARPWRTKIDLGKRPAPHELAAVAFDAAGRELGRARQWVNRARAEAEAFLVVEPAREGTGRIAHLTWRATGFEDPDSVTITFDGRRLDVADRRTFALPAYVPEQVHFLRADVEFPRNVSAVAEVLLGGQRHDEALTSLTAIPVLLEPGAKAPTLASLASALRKGGETLRVAAIEDGPSEAVFITTPAAVQELRRLARTQTGLAAVLAPPAHLGKDQSIRVLSAVPRVRRVPAAQVRSFPLSPTLPSTKGGLARAITSFGSPSGEPLIANAVSLAGIASTSLDRRRAAVLLLGSESEDRSPLDVADVRAFLRDLQVPFFVWSLSATPTSAGARWAPAEDAHTNGLLRKAADRLAEHLERQRIVWVEGTHLPHQVELSPDVKGIRIAR